MATFCASAAFLQSHVESGQSHVESVQSRAVERAVETERHWHEMFITNTRFALRDRCCPHVLLRSTRVLARLLTYSAEQVVPRSHSQHNLFRTTATSHCDLHCVDESSRVGARRNLYMRIHCFRSSITC